MCIDYFHSESDKMDYLTMKDIHSSCRKIGKSGIEMAAYLHALGEAKGLNVDKHHHPVEKELNQDGEKEGSIFQWANRFILH